MATEKACLTVLSIDLEIRDCCEIDELRFLEKHETFRRLSR